LLLIVLAVACLTAAVLLVGEVLTASGRQRARSIRVAAGYGRRLFSEPDAHESFRERVVLPSGRALAGLVLRLSPKTTLESVRVRLMGAGLSRAVSPLGFLAAKALLAMAGLLGGALLGAASSRAAAILLLAVAFGGCGYLLPDVFITLRTRARREQMRAQLPNALDLLAVSVEAGLGFDAALAKLSDRMGGPLAEELGLLLREIRIGESRDNALKKLAGRTGVAEVGSFVRAMIQADQLGMSMGRILRVQAADARLKRQAAAEERAMKAPVKMLFPTVLFIFPAMFLVILGPAFIHLFELF
jgi:tight adherence protein C